MTDFLLRADPEMAAYLHAAIDPLSKPVPDADGPDPRSPATRRADALLTVIQRGMTSPAGAPTTAKAKVVVVFTYDQLIGALEGIGVTTTGDTLTAGVVRRMACDADLVPAVYGTDSELLDLGRTARLASPAQHHALWLRDRGCSYPGCSVPPTWCRAHHQALWLRDRGCSYPGCSVPPTWCRAHHLTWWSRGGHTNLDNLVLLCDRHHTIVHERNLTAEVTTTGVRWHT